MAPRARLAYLRVVWVLRSPRSQSYWQKIILSFDLSSPHQHLNYNYLSSVTVRSRCNDWETSKPVKTSFLVGRGQKLPTCYDWSFYAAQLTQRRGIQTPAHSEHWAGSAMLAARVQGKCVWSDPVMALIPLEIFSLALMGFGSGTKEATLHFPNLSLLSAQQNNQIPSIYFCMSALHEGHDPPPIHTQATSVTWYFPL